MMKSTHSSSNTNDACIIYEHNRSGTMVIKHDLDSLFYCDIMDDDLHANSDCNFMDENESDFVVNEELGLLYNRSTISSDYDTSITISYVESYDESFMDIFYEFDDDDDHDSVSGHSYLFGSESTSLSDNDNDINDNEYDNESVSGHSFYKNDNEYDNDSVSGHSYLSHSDINHNEYDNEYETDSVSGHSFYKNDESGSLSLQASTTDNKCVDVGCIIHLE